MNNNYYTPLVSPLFYYNAPNYCFHHCYHYCCRIITVIFHLKQQLRVANETRQPNLKDFLWSE